MNCPQCNKPIPSPGEACSHTLSNGKIRIRYYDKPPETFIWDNKENNLILSIKRLVLITEERIDMFLLLK